MDDESDIHFVEESSEWVDVQHESSNSSSFLDQSNMADTSDYLDESLDSTRSLRSSRRRVQKHSAVVLSSQRMKKITSHSRSNDSNANPGELEQIIEESEEEEFNYDTSKNDAMVSPNKPPTLSTSLLQKISPTSKKSPQLNPSDPLKQKRKPKISETQAALMILEWWNQKKKHRLLKFTQHGQWSFHVANKFFALILGHRVRKIFQSSEIQKLISAQKDLRHVLQELLEQSIKEPKVHSPKSSRSIQTIPQTIDYWLTYLQKLQSSQSVLPVSDQIFAKSLIKQLLAEREKLIKTLYQDSQWVAYPKPGYRHFNRQRFLKKASATTPSTASKTAIGSPARPLRSSALLKKKVQDTPPHVKAALEPSAIQAKAMKKSLKVNQLPTSQRDDHSEDSNSGGVSSELHLLENTSLLSNPDDRPLTGSGFGKVETGGRTTAKPAVRKGNTNTTTSLFKVQSALEESKESGSLSSNRSSESSSRPSTANRSRASNNSNVAASVTVSQSVVKKRSGDGGHIQLEIISAEKLIPAKKGAAKEGNPVADRKPCVKVIFYLPNTNSGAASAATPLPKSPGAGTTADNGLKKVFQQSRDYNILTLNPKFNCSFIINLPFSKQVLRTTIERQQLTHLFDNISEGEEDYLSDHEYELIVKAMLQHWSSGIVEIEIYDGERFNEEIFMGRVQLLVTSFLPLIRKFHELEMKGSYTLEKAKPKDRVSGSVLLAAYLHVPEKKYVEEQLVQLLTSMKYQEMEASLATNTNRRSTLTAATKASNANNIKAYKKAPGSAFAAGEDSSFNNFSSADDGGNESSSSEIYRGNNHNNNNRRLSHAPPQTTHSGNLPLRGTLSVKNLVEEEHRPASAPAPAPALSHHRKTRQSIMTKIPMPGSHNSPTAGEGNSHNSSHISNHMKSLAHKKIPSQGDLTEILNAPIQDESVNIKLPASNQRPSDPSANTGSHLKSPNSIYFRSPFTPSPTQQLLQQGESGHSSATSSASKQPPQQRSYHRRISSLDLNNNNTPPPISSLAEVRGSHIPVSAIVSHEVAVESTLNKRLFLEGMSKQLSGLEALVQQTSNLKVNDQVLAENLSKKLHTRHVSQVMDVSGSVAVTSQKPTTTIIKEEAPKSPIRLPSGYQPRVSSSPSSYGALGGTGSGSNSGSGGGGGSSKSQYVGRASLTKGLNDLKSQVNQTVQNLEKFLVDIPVLADPEEAKNKHLFSSDEEEEEEKEDDEEEVIPTHYQEKAKATTSTTSTSKSMNEPHPNKYKHQHHQTPPSTTTTNKMTKATPSPTKIPTVNTNSSAGKDRNSFGSSSTHHHHYYEDDAFDSDDDRMYEEDEDHQFRKHKSFTKKSPVKPGTTASTSAAKPPQPGSATRRKTSISSDSEDDSSFNDEKYRIHAKGISSLKPPRADTEEEEEEEDDEEEDTEEEKSRQAKRISTRDLANQHPFKYHSPDSPTKKQSASSPNKVPPPFPIPSTTTTPGSGTKPSTVLVSPTKPSTTSTATTTAMSRSASKDSTTTITSSASKKPVTASNHEPFLSPTHSFDYSIASNSTNPSLPARTSSKLYESKSLSHSDIEELNQRVKQLSQLSYSTEGEGLANSNKSEVFSPPTKSVSKDESVISTQTTATTGSKSGGQRRQAPAPPPPSTTTTTQGQVSRSPTKDSVTSQSKVQAEDRYVENEHAMNASPKKEGVASILMTNTTTAKTTTEAEKRPATNPLPPPTIATTTSTGTTSKGLKSPKVEKQKPPQPPPPPPPPPRSLQLAQPSPTQSSNLKKGSGLNSPSQIPSLRTSQRTKRVDTQLSSPSAKNQSSK